MKRAILLFLLWSVSGFAATTEVRQDRTTRVLVGRATIVSSNFLGQTTQPLSQFAATTSAELAVVLSDETGSGGGFVRATSPTLTTPALGTPSAVDLANATNLPIATGVSGLGTGVATWLATPSSANLASVLTDETGSSGGFVRAGSPTFTGDLSADDIAITGNGALSDPALSITGTPITGGTATTTKPLVLIETAGATSAGWSTSGTMLGVNAPSGFGGHLISAHYNGTVNFLVSAAGAVTMRTPLTLADATAQISLNSDTILRRAAAANLALGAADAASPVAQTISVQNVAAGTTDTAGVSTMWNASRGTGTGVGGDHIFQTAASSTTGNTQNTLLPQLRVTSQGGIRIGGSGTPPWLFPFTGSSATSITANGSGLSFYSYLTGAANDTSWAFTGSAVTGTSGSSRSVYLTRSFSPTSGTANFANLEVQTTVNQTGGANGITRGVYINPTLTAAADHRSLEIAAGNVRLASATEINWNGDLPVGRDAAATLQLGTDAASPVNQSLKAADGSGTDKDGGDLTLSGGQPTGTGRGGDTVLRTGLTGSTGSSLGALSTRQFDSAKWVDLTESTDTQFATVTCGTGKYLGAQLVVTVNANDASDFQALTSTLNVNAVNKAGTITKTVTQVDGTTAASAGTLTATYVVTDNGSGVLGIKVNAVSSLTQTQLRAKWSITALNSDDVATITPN